MSLRIPKLFAEIIEVYEKHVGASTAHLMAILNGPARVQARGHYVTDLDALDVVIHMHCASKDSRP